MQFHNILILVTKGESIQVIYSDLNIDIYNGDFTVIMGSSGAGKSTLMYSLSGMDKPDGGEITFDGNKGRKCNVYYVKDGKEAAYENVADSGNEISISGIFSELVVDIKGAIG